MNSLRDHLVRYKAGRDEARGGGGKSGARLIGSGYAFCKAHDRTVSKPSTVIGYQICGLALLWFIMTTLVWPVYVYYGDQCYVVLLNVQSLHDSTMSGSSPWEIRSSVKPP